MMENIRKLNAILIVTVILFSVAIPASIREGLFVSIDSARFFLPELIVYVIFIISLAILLYGRRLGYWHFAFMASFISLFLSNMFVYGMNFMKYFTIGADFILAGTIVYANRNGFRLKWVWWILAFTFAIIVSQVILISLGIVHIEREFPDYVYGKLIRPGTTAGGATFTACLLLVLMGVLLINCQTRLKSMMISVIGGFSICLTMSRGAMLTLFVALCLYVMTNTRSFKSVLVVLGVAILLIIGGINVGVWEAMADRGKEVNSDVSSGRFERWDNAMNGLSDFGLLVGRGSGHSPYYRAIWYSDVIDISPHNTFLSYLVENGILGAISYGVLIMPFLLSTFRKFSKHHHLSFASYILVCTILIAMNTEVIFRDYNLALVFWILYFLAEKERNENCIYNVS